MSPPEPKRNLKELIRCETAAIISIAESADLLELDWQDQGQRVRLKRSPGEPGFFQPLERGEETEGLEETVAEPFTVKAPVVGRFYFKRPPAEAVAVGNEVEAGDVIGMIESMRVEQELHSEVSGRVLEILVRDGQPVEYGQPILSILPVGS